MRSIVALVIAGLAVTASGCASVGPSETVSVSTRVTSTGTHRVELVVSATTCWNLDATVHRDGTNLVVTGRGHAAVRYGDCGNAIEHHAPTNEIAIVDLDLPDGTYTINGGSPFLWSNGVVSSGTASDSPQEQSAQIARLRDLTQQAAEELTRALPDWPVRNCAQGNDTDDTSADFKAQFVCVLGVPAAIADADDVIIPLDGVAHAFGCTPVDNAEDDEVRCVTTLNGVRVTVHIARLGDEATLAIEIRR